VTRLTTAQFRALDELGIPYLSFDSHPARTYPDGAVAGNLVGFVGSDAQPLAGLEQTENDCLAAKNGHMSWERGKDGVTIPGTRSEQPAENGGTLTLTIDRDLQWYLQQLIAEQVGRLKAKSGTITVVEVATGKVRAAAEYPTVDPNDIEGSNPDFLFSQVFTDTFEPGSTFKALTAAALIESGKAKPTSTVTASSREKFPNGARVGDFTSHPKYTYTLTGVLIDSSNVGISKFAERLSAQKRYEFLDRFGIGHGSAIGFGGEEKGTLHPADEWDNQTFYNVSFGQGLTTTVPELVGAYQAIANDGVKVPLSLIESCTKADGSVVAPEAPGPERILSEKTAVQVQRMLENVSTQGGLAKQIKIPGYRIATKTGTAEKTDGKGRYKSGAYFTTMIGFAPADDPQYIVAVTLDEPTRVKSSAANAPAFQKAMTQVLKNFRVMPATSTSTKLPKFG
jgi:cell division protein FtsI (penicillin-binding protein 3)